MNDAQAKFVARGKIEWQRGSILAFRSRLKGLQECAPEIDISQLLLSLADIEQKLNAKIAADFPTTSGSAARSKKDGTRTPD